MHAFDETTEDLARAIVAYARGRIANAQPLDGPVAADVLTKRAGETVTPDGIGWEEALRIWGEVLAPATISTDHPAFLAFVPGAPTKASVLFDLVVGASSTIAAGWLDGGGAVWAENEALRWIGSLAGFPGGSGGVFVSGGSAGNLSALVTARHGARKRAEPDSNVRWRFAACDSVHSSVRAAARVMDVDVLSVDGDERGRLTGDALTRMFERQGTDGVFAVVASAGATNTGIVDDLAGVADVCAERGIWFHVDAAYGGAGLLAPSARGLFDGIERADSFIVDPHKWLFAPYDACALMYREPSIALEAHRQTAAYLDAAYEIPEWNPCDYAYHLTRRARGLPMWFSLATYGTSAYRDAVEATLSLTRDVAEEIRSRDNVDLVLEPELSVLLFRRLGWSSADYEAWWRRLLEAQIGFVQPTSWQGEKVARFCFVNPLTTIEHVRAILGTMA